MNKSHIPTKTKIAAWIMMVIGGIGTIGGLLVAILGFRETTIEIEIFLLLLGMILFLPSSTYFFSGLLLLARKRIAWMFSVGASSIGMVSSLVVPSYLFGWNSIDRWLDIRHLFGWLDIRDLFVGSLFWDSILHLYFLVLVLFSLFTLILLLFDRKNYWKIAS
jgi:hypothetical protein